MASSVWVQVYIGDASSEDINVCGSAFEIKPLREGMNISDLKEAVKAKQQPELDFLAADELTVYAAGTAFPIPDGTEPLDPGDPVPKNTSSNTKNERPGTLIVVAPAPPEVGGFAQHDAVPEEYKQLAAFAREEMDNRTKHKPMSEASVLFAQELLRGYGLSVSVAPLITACGSREDPPPYSWKVVDGKSNEWKKGEHAGTPEARDWLRENLLGDGTPFGIKVVAGSPLPKVKANRRSASGKGDLAIGDPHSMKFGEEYLFANGLIELKTDEYPLKTGQVERRIYQHGRKAWEDFMELIKSPETRSFKVRMEVIGEVEEQNLDGFSFGDHESKRLKAVQDEADLNRMADYLGEIYGERPVVPAWARAESRVPDYYV